ncbi:MAG: hypothetical protein AB7G11_15980, partial [Phycisphaerales bacterium]
MPPVPLHADALPSSPPAPRPQRAAVSTLVVLCCLGLALVPPGCKSRPRAAPDLVRAEHVQVAGAVYLFPGRAFVVPISESEARTHLASVDRRRRAGKAAYIRPIDFPVLIDSQPASAELYWLHRTPRHEPGAVSTLARATSIAARAAAWTGQSVGGLDAPWRVTSADELDLDARPPGGAWIAVVRTDPIPLAPGRICQLRIGADPDRPNNAGIGRAATAIVLGPPLVGTQAGPTPWVRSAQLTPALLDSPWMQASLQVLAASPTQRWRVRLALGTPKGLPATDSGAPVAAEDLFLDPNLEALASQVELHWLSALSRLAEVDPSLASAIAHELTRAIDFGRGIAVPLWSADSPVETALLEQLLDPGASRPALASTARTFLDARPASLAWTIDDAGSLDALSGQSLGRVALANLTDSPSFARAAVSLRPAAADLVAVEPGAARTIPVIPAPPVPGAASPRPAALDSARDGAIVQIQLGRTELRRRICPAPVPAAPPGCTLGPTRPDFNTYSLLAQAAAPNEFADPGPWAVGSAALGRAPDSAWITAARVYFGSPVESPVVAPGSADDSGQWMLFIECVRLSPADPTPPPDTDPMGFVRVWFGPSGSPQAIYRMRWDGSITVELGGGGG